MASPSASPPEVKKEEQSSKSEEQAANDATTLKLVPERASPEPSLAAGDVRKSFIRYTKEQLCAWALIPPSLKKPEALTAPLIRDDPGNLPELKPLTKAEIKELLSRDRDFMTASGTEISTNPRNNSRPIRRWKTDDEPAKDDEDDGEFILSPSRKAFPSSQAGASLPPSDAAASASIDTNTRRHQNSRALAGAPPGFGGRRDGAGGGGGGRDRDGPNARSNPNNSRDRQQRDRQTDPNRSRGGEGGRPLGPPPGLGGSMTNTRQQAQSRDAAAEAELAPVDLGLTRDEMAKMSPMELFERERQIRRAVREGKPPAAATAAAAAAAAAASSQSPSTPKASPAAAAASSSSAEVPPKSTDPLDLLFQKKLFVDSHAADEKEPAGNFNRWFDSKTTSPGATPVSSSSALDASKQKEPSPLGSSLLSLIGGSGSSSSVGSTSSSTGGGGGSLLSLIAENKPIAPAAVAVAPTPSAGPASWGAPTPSGAPSWGKPAAAASEKKPAAAEEKTKQAASPLAPAVVPVGSFPPPPPQQQQQGQPQPQPPPANALHMLFQTAKYNPSMVNARPPNFESMQTADAIEGRLRQAPPPSLPASTAAGASGGQAPQQQQQQQQQPGQFTSPAILSLLNNTAAPHGGGALPPSVKPDFAAPRPKGEQQQQQQHPPPHTQHMMPPPYPYPPPYGKMPPQSMPPPMMHPPAQGHFYGPPQGYLPPQMHMPPQHQPMPGGGSSGDGLARWFKLPAGSAAPHQTGAPRPPPAQIKSLEEIEGKFGGASSPNATTIPPVDAKK